MIVVVSDKPFIEEILLQVPQFERCGICTVTNLPTKHNYKIIITDSKEHVSFRIANDVAEQEKVEKVFHFDELVKKMKMILQDFYQRNFSWNDFSFDKNKREIRFGSLCINLTEKESELIYYLLIAYPDGLNKETLLQKIWKYDSSSSTNTLDTHIYGLKSKFKNTFAIDFIEIKDGYYFINKNITK